MKQPREPVFPMRHASPSEARGCRRGRMRHRGIEPRADAQSVLVPPRRRARRLARSLARAE
eukprot:6868904-Prymnesium_polylepis.1